MNRPAPCFEGFVFGGLRWRPSRPDQPAMMGDQSTQALERIWR